MNASLSAVGGVRAKLVWYRNRLRLMSLPEVMHRAMQTVAKRAMRYGVGRAAQAPAPRTLAFGRPWCARLPQGIDAAPYAAAADEILAGRWNVFALRGAPLGFPPQWNRDPQTGRVAPLVFGKTLDYRDESRVGNIKYLWEPSRHLELTTLAQAYYLTRAPRYLEGCGTLLASWFDQCPYPLGAQWASALELAVRLVNWAVTWHLIGGADSALFAGAQGQALRDRWLGQVWLHAQFIRGFLSRYSSANNHLLGEYMGLLIAGLTWPCWPQARRWRQIGQRGFEAEALRQNASDGVNREQGIYYHHEVADMMLLCGLFGQANGVEFSEAYWQRLEGMIGFIGAVSDIGGHVPMIGDADDALMVRFDPSRGFDPYRSLRATGAAIFGDANPLDAKTRWLLGELPYRRRASGALQPQRAYPEGGYWILGDAIGKPDEARIVADAGPLGYLSIAAHGHADALAFVFSVAGREVLIDPGTYAYHTQKKWRDYFRGTSAHNTVRIDGMDQSEIGGNFMWLRKASARCLGFETSSERDRWSAEHDGYRRLADPVLHRRHITLMKAQRSIEVVDEVFAKRTHEVELFWHFAEGCEVQPEGDHGLVARTGDQCVRLHCPGWRLSLHRGDADRPLGWVSRRFDEKQPCWTARFAGTIHRDTRITTLLSY
jgi:hypothetical protein